MWPSLDFQWMYMAQLRKKCNLKCLTYIEVTDDIVKKFLQDSQMKFLVSSQSLFLHVTVLPGSGFETNSESAKMQPPRL